VPDVGMQISGDASDQMEINSVKLTAGTKKSKSKFVGLRSLVHSKLPGNHATSQGGWRAIPFIYGESP
jgi:hypothetical protein